MPADPRQYRAGRSLPLPGYGHMLASAKDKEQVIGALKDAFLAGRLTKDEFDERVGRALVSRKYGDLYRLTEDLPVPPPGHPFPSLSPAVVPASRRANGVAVTALVLALIPGLTSPVALLLGLIARSQISDSGQRGIGMANAAIVIGGLFTVLLVLYALRAI